MEDREQARKIIGDSCFIEVYLSTSLEICEKRDPHLLYQKARQGEIKNFTGISAPYEAPKNPDVAIDTNALSIQECVAQLLRISK